MSALAIARTVLAADAGLIALVPASRIIADDAAPQNTDLPYVLVKLVSGVDFKPLNITGSVLTTQRVQVEVYAADALSRKAVKKAIRNCALTNQVPTVGGYERVTIHTESEGPDFLLEDGMVRMGTQDLMVTYTETAG